MLGARVADEDKELGNPEIVDIRVKLRRFPFNLWFKTQIKLTEFTSLWKIKIRMKFKFLAAKLNSVYFKITMIHELSNFQTMRYAFALDYRQDRICIKIKYREEWEVIEHITYFVAFGAVSIRNKPQTAVINMAIKRMLENKVHKLDIHLQKWLLGIELTTKFKFKISN